MIRHLTLKDVGPARNLRFAFSPRLNVLTGDNGLGKTFVLDVLWWVLTTTWAGEKAFPFRPPEDSDGSGSGDPTPLIQALLAHRTGERKEREILVGGTYEWTDQSWVRSPYALRRGPTGTPWRDDAHDRKMSPPDSLVIYARIDGSYAVFDAHYAKGGIASFADAAIVLSPSELWDGKDVADSEVQGGKRTVIAGLIADWVSWQQRGNSPEFAALQKVLLALSSPDEPLVPHEPARVHLRDRRDIPTLATSYGVVPVTLASAGMKRALSLAYLLVWAWAEHETAAKASRRKPTGDVVLLIDEPELHQHPTWQRAFLPAVLKAVGMVAPSADVQVFTATHSPLVLASLESAWVEESDDLFVLERDGSLVKAEELPFTKEGDVSSWLSSTVFGHVGGRSQEGALAIAAAMDHMAGRTKDAERRIAELEALLSALGAPLPSTSDPRHPLVERIHAALTATLPGHDRFWARWVTTWDTHMVKALRS